MLKQDVLSHPLTTTNTDNASNPTPPAPANATSSQTPQARGGPLRRTRSGRILDQIASVATKITGGRRVRKSASTTDVIEEVEDSGTYVLDHCTTLPDPSPPSYFLRGAATTDDSLQQPQAPEPHPSGGKTAKQIDGAGDNSCVLRTFTTVFMYL